jgi:hypothetical protein
MRACVKCSWELNSPVKRWTIEKSVDGFNFHVGSLDLQFSLIKQSGMVAKAVILLLVVHVLFNILFCSFNVHNLLSITVTELCVWATLTYYLVGVSAKNLAVWIALFIAVDGLFTVYGYGPWLSAELPELLLWVLIAKRFAASWR